MDNTRETAILLLLARMKPRTKPNNNDYQGQNQNNNDYYPQKNHEFINLDATPHQSNSYLET